MNILPIYASTSVGRFSNQQKVNSNMTFGYVKKSTLVAPKFKTEMSQTIIQKISKYLQQIQGSFKIPSIVVSDGFGKQASLSIVKDSNASRFGVRLLDENEGKVSNIGVSLSPKGCVNEALYADNSGKSYLYCRHNTDGPFIDMKDSKGNVRRYGLRDQQWLCISENGFKVKHDSLKMDKDDPLADMMLGIIDKNASIFAC